MPRSTPPKRLNALHAFGTALRPCMRPYNQPPKRCAGIRTRTNGKPFFANDDPAPHRQPPRSPQTTARVHPAPMTLRSSQATTLSLTNSRFVLHEQTARVHPAPITLRSSQAMAQRFSDDRFRLHKPRGTAPCMRPVSSSPDNPGFSPAVTTTARQTPLFRVCGPESSIRD